MPHLEARETPYLAHLVVSTLWMSRAEECTAAEECRASAEVTLQVTVTTLSLTLHEFNDSTGITVKRV